MSGSGVQVALLREKLAKEQQRARAAEATLTAHHHLHHLLQSAVQAVLLARNGTQVQAYCMAVLIHSYVHVHEHMVSMRFA